MSSYANTEPEGTDLEQHGMDRISSPLCFLEDVPIPERTFTADFGAGALQLRLKGYFYEEFFCRDKIGVCTPPIILRADQVIRYSSNEQILPEIPIELALVNPAHFFGYLLYVREVSKIFTQLPMKSVRLEVISFAIGHVHKSLLIMRAWCTANGIFEISVESASSFRGWAPGTHVISRSH